MSPILWPGKDEPKCLLTGIDKVTFWGEHTVILGWYASKEDCEKEIKAIAEALRRGEGAYDLQYHAEVESGPWGSPKLKKN